MTNIFHVRWIRLNSSELKQCLIGGQSEDLSVTAVWRLFCAQFRDAHQFFFYMDVVSERFFHTFNRLFEWQGSSEVISYRTIWCHKRGNLLSYRLLSRNVKIKNVHDCNFASCCVWVRNFVSWGKSKDTGFLRTGCWEKYINQRERK